MKKILRATLLSILVATAITACKKEVITADYQTVPLPQSIGLKEGTSFTLNSSTKIVYPEGNEKLEKTAKFLVDYLKFSTGLSLETTTLQSTTGNAIILKAEYPNTNKEAYQLSTSSTQITINGASEAGTFYGTQTLRKSVPAYSENKEVSFPQVEINDCPRFGYRGMMLDCARSFYPVEFVKEYIDILAMHNINRFHWHLTDDQGWRIEIKKYPKLTEIGSVRKQTVIGRKDSGKYDNTPYTGFYTQDEAREIVAYAADRFITVIPEIDLPGHMLAALTGYPELGCTGGPYEVATSWGIFDDVLCAGNEKTFEFLKGVFSEIVDIFPSHYIHIGGDECPKTQWEKCSKCQAKIKELGIKGDSKHTAEQKLQSYCMARVEKYLNSKERDIIGWDEILEGGIAPNATIMSWRGTEGGIEAAQQHHNAIMTPSPYLYFDYFQAPNIEDELYLPIGRFLPIDRVYNYEPLAPELTEEQRKYVIGVQANLWTEYIPKQEQVEYQLMPRIDALSEVQWTMPENKNYQNFIHRLAGMLKYYDKLGYNYAKHIFNVQADITPDATTKSVKVILSTFDDAPIYYSLTGKDVNIEKQLYTEPLKIDKEVTLSAVAQRDGKVNKPFTKKLYVSKSTFKPIKLETLPHPKYTYAGASMLVDGLAGGDSYGDGNWLGFNNKDGVDILIDLETLTEISSIKIGTFINTTDWAFGSTGFTVDVSSDGVLYDRAVSRSYGEIGQETPTGRLNLEASFNPVKAKFVRIHIAKTREIPTWHGAWGQSPFLFIDEISIN